MNWYESILYQINRVLDLLAVIHVQLQSGNNVDYTESVNLFMQTATVVLAVITFAITFFAVVIGISFLRRNKIIEEVESLVDKKMTDQAKSYFAMQKGLFGSWQKALQTTSEFITSAREFVVSGREKNDDNGKIEEIRDNLNSIIQMFNLNKNYAMLVSDNEGDVELAIRGIWNLGDPSSIEYLNLFIYMRDGENRYEKLIRLADAARRELEGKTTYSHH